MDDARHALVFGEDAFKGFVVAAVHLLESGTHPGDLFDAVHHVCVGV